MATAKNARERRTVWIVLAINIGLALAFFATGAFGDSSALIANGLDNLSDSFVYAVEWTGRDTYIQKTGIASDFGTFDTPDDFYLKHRQNFGILRDWLYRHIIRRWMNRRVRVIRRGHLLRLPGFAPPNHRHEETNSAA